MYIVINAIALVWMRKKCMSSFDVKLEVFIENTEWHGHDHEGWPSHKPLPI